MVTAKGADIPFRAGLCQPPPSYVKWGAGDRAQSIEGTIVFERILKRMQEKVRKRQYVMTLHAEEEMNDDGLTIYDVERGILTGEILERQKNRVTAEWKYRIRGETVEGDEVEVIAKLSPTGKLVIITVYIS